MVEVDKAQPGTSNLAVAVISLFPEIGTFGIYSKRDIRGGTEPSKHSEGRAWDARCYDSGIGDKLRRVLIKHRKELGIEKIIWMREVWQDGLGTNEYTGVNPHTDHLHIEQSWDKARDNPLTVKEIKEIISK